MVIKLFFSFFSKKLFELEFYCQVNIVKVMLSESVNQLTQFLDRLSPLSIAIVKRGEPHNIFLISR